MDNATLRENYQTFRATIIGDIIDTITRAGREKVVLTGDEIITEVVDDQSSVAIFEVNAKDQTYTTYYMGDPNGTSSLTELPTAVLLELHEQIMEQSFI